MEQSMAEPKSPPKKLLCKRKTGAEMLDVSVDKIKELERLGYLTRVRLPGRTRGEVLLRVDEVMALAKGGAADA